MGEERFFYGLGLGCLAKGRGHGERDFEVELENHFSDWMALRLCFCVEGAGESGAGAPNSNETDSRNLTQKATTHVATSTKI